MTGLTSPTQLELSNDRVIASHFGALDGPTLVAIGALHGNEPAGVEAISRIHSWLHTGAGIQRGAFVALRGNLATLRAGGGDPHTHPRYLDHDLNRVFRPGEDGIEGTAEVRERDELRIAFDAVARKARGPVYLLDLHTASSPSPPFIAYEDSLQARRFAMQFELPKILGLEEELAGLLIDEATNRFGFVSLIIEGGRHDSPDSVRVLEAALRVAIDELALCPGVRIGDAQRTLRHAARGREGHFYDVRSRREIRRIPFEMVEGAQAFGRVRAGRTVLAIEDGQKILADESGQLQLPNRQTDPRVGDDAYFVVRRVSRVWLVFSSWLRTKEWIHGLLPRLLLGVRRREGYEHDLMVETRIAVILRRQIFHLLGYRLVRFSAQPGVHPVRRALSAVQLLLLSFVRAAIPTRSREDRGTPAPEEHEVWIVRRRLLDVCEHPHLLNKWPETNDHKPDMRRD